MTDSKDAQTTLDIIRFSWRTAGGWRAFWKSAEFRVAILVCAAASQFWTGTKWPDQVIAVVPNLLGFTLSGFAIFLGFGSDDFKTVISGETEGRSVYLSVSAAFINFVVFQLAALMWALVANALFFETPSWLMPVLPAIQLGAAIGGAIGYFLFCVSVMMVFRAAIRIFRLSRWYRLYLVGQQAPKTRTAAPGSATASEASNDPQ